MRRKILVLMILLFVFINLFGCNTVKEAKMINGKIITDCIGRHVSIPKEPKRVACLYASTGHMLALLDEAAKIVGAPDGLRRDTLMLIKNPDIKNVAVPFTNSTINIEELSRIKADIALVRKNTASNLAETEKLNKLGIPYVVVDYANIAELKTAIKVVGEIFGKQEHAQNYISFIDKTIHLVKERTTKISLTQKKRVYHAVNEATRTDTKGDICTEITNLSGIVNVSVDGRLNKNEDKYYTTLEQIYAWSPDYIIANDPLAAKYMLADSKWAGISAVKNKNVFVLPVGVSRWCHPGSIEPQMAILFLAKQFYPENFKDINLIDYTKSYYQTFFHLSLNNDQIIQILSGNGMRVPK